MPIYSKLIADGGGTGRPAPPPTPDWLKQRLAARRTTYSPAFAGLGGAGPSQIPFTPAPPGIPDWLRQMIGPAPPPSGEDRWRSLIPGMQPAEAVASFPRRTHTATATDQPTVQELNEAYWRERQRQDTSLGGLLSLLGRAGEGFLETFGISPPKEIPREGRPAYLGGAFGGRGLPPVKEEAPAEPEIELDPYSTRGAFPFWEEKYADLLRSVPETTETPPTWYDTGGGWYPWGGGGGATYTPQKAASRWWMNLAKWNI